MKILLADDEVGIAERIETVLRRDSHEVVVVHSGEDALSMVRQFESAFDLVITDVRMGELSGIDLLEKIHATQIGVPVVVLTGHGDLDTAIKAVKAGAIDFINKPFSLESLRGAVAKAERINMGGIGREEPWPIASERVELVASLEGDADFVVVDHIVGLLRPSIKRKGGVLRSVSDPLLCILGEVASSGRVAQVRVMAEMEGSALRLGVSGVDGDDAPLLAEGGSGASEIERVIQAYAGNMELSSDGRSISVSLTLDGRGSDSRKR